MPPPNLRFGRFELQPHERRLLVDGSPAALGARAFDLLLAMATRPGQLVTKAELLDDVWPRARWRYSSSGRALPTIASRAAPTNCRCCARSAGGWREAITWLLAH